MSTASTHNPARTDAAPTAPIPAAPPAPPRRGRGWAVAGIVAGLAGVGTIYTTMSIDGIYDPALDGDTAGKVAKLATQLDLVLAFHLSAGLSAVALIVFAAGLHRRLRAGAPDGLSPMIAFAGLFGTAVVTVLGSALNTEFYFGLQQGMLDGDPNAVFFGHWIGTVPWVWVLAGLAGTAVFAASRTRPVAGVPTTVLPRWIGWVGLLLGGFTLLLGLSPLQYLAGFVGPIWVLVTALGFTLGDRAAR